MPLLITAIVAILSIFLSKYLFKYYYNPITIYLSIWILEIFLYELKLIRYYNISLHTWMMIGSAYLSYVFGILTLFFFKKLYKFKETVENDLINETEKQYDNKKVLNSIIYCFAILGILGAIQHWSVLFKEFGSLTNILINAAKIYRMRVEGEIHGVLPYITTLLYVSIFFSGIYTGKYGKFSFGLFLSFVGVILDELASVGRFGMLFAFLMFFNGLFVYRLNRKRSVNTTNINKKLVLTILAVLIIIVSFSSFVKSVRVGGEAYQSSSRKLDKLKNSNLITPSIYLYFSSQIGVLNKYFEKDEENVTFGQNTFLPIYNILSKFNLVKRTNGYQKGYFIPIWTNTGTYIREIHADFGYSGVFIIPFIIGFFIASFWIKYLESRRLSHLTILVYLILAVQFSFLIMISRMGIWWISMLIILIINQLLINWRHIKTQFNKIIKQSV
jgi:oligosaccharide repeat unit polymerase